MISICLVASELLGAHKNGGIGTATSKLAYFLAGAEYKVDVIYTGDAPIDYAHPWAARLIRSGVRLTHLDVQRQPVYPTYLREASALFDYLRNTSYNLILFQDWRGGAFSCIQARNAGLAFHSTRLAVIAHGPTEWLLEVNRTAVRNVETLAQLHMERTVLEGADAVLCPSQYMKEWIRARGFSVKEIVHIPLYLWADGEEDVFRPSVEGPNSVLRIGYFGRLEDRKGIALFLNALLDERFAYLRFDIHFIGKEATWDEQQVRQLLRSRRPWLESRMFFFKDLDSDQSQAHLIKNDCLAVIPSLVDNAPCVISECLRRRIPFIASATGGIPEQIAEIDRKRVLFAPKPTALADMLDAIVYKPFKPARAAYDAINVGKQWLDWIATQRSSPRQIAVAEDISDRFQKVTVVLTHYERPHLVNQTLAGLSVQTYKNFDVVLVDDGSKSDEAQRNLEKIEKDDWPFQIKLLRCANRYLGAARNEGIRASDSDLIVFMDDDNIPFPDMIERFVAARHNLDADIVTCQMTIFRNAHVEPDLELLRSGERWCFTGGPTELGLSVNCFGDATGIYKRSVFDKVGYFHEWHGIGHEDWHLHARASLHGLKLVSLPVPLYWYRRVEGTMLHTTDQIENNRIIWDLYRQSLPPNLARLADLSIRNSLFP